METLNLKWTVSKGRDTYGYNICSLWVRGRKVASCNGGGYDMQGVCFATYLTENYKDRIEKLEANHGLRNGGRKGFYGLHFYNHKGKRLIRKGKTGRVFLDGSCGFGCMVKIAKRVGLDVRGMYETRRESVYSIVDKKGGRRGKR